MNKAYNNITYCVDWDSCKYGNDCPRALTEEVQEAAIKWWGSDEAPVDIFADTPHCFEGQ